MVFVCNCCLGLPFRLCLPFPFSHGVAIQSIEVIPSSQSNHAQQCY